MKGLQFFLIFATIIASAATAAPSSVGVLSAYYMPDPQPPPDSNLVEGELKPRTAGKIFAPLQKLYTDYADFGGARIVLRNDGKQIMRIGSVELNGKPVEAHYVDFLDSEWDDRGVVWYRVRPNLMRPGQCAEVYMRFRRRPAGDAATVKVQLGDGSSVAATIPYTERQLQIEYVMADESRQTLYIYARRTNGAAAGKLTSVSLDGVPLENVSIYGGDFPGGIALAVAALPSSLRIGDFHVAGAQASGGQSTAAQFRVLPFFFMRTSWNWGPSEPEHTRELHMNTWFKSPGLPAERYEELGVYADSGRHERHRFEYYYDEPDAKDQAPGCFEKYGEWQDEPPDMTGRAWARGLGRNARQRVTCGMFERDYAQIPHAANYIITNGTTRPLNCAVYGQLTDIASTDPYPVNFFGADHTLVREQHAYMWRVSRPAVMHACMEAYHEGSISDRGPTGAEYRQNTIQAIGCGAKGIHSWVAGGSNGWRNTEDLKSGVIAVNAIAEHIEDDLVLGVPIDIVSNDAGQTEAGSFWYLEPGEYQLDKRWIKEKVWTGALLCGPDAIVIAAANHIPASRSPPDIAPTENVTVTVQLPDFLQSVAAFEVTAAGESAYACSVGNGTAEFTIDAIASGRIFVLRRK